MHARNRYDQRYQCAELMTSGYCLESENNSVKLRVGINLVGMHISKLISYIRRVELEGLDSNLTIIDLVGESLDVRTLNCKLD